MKRLITRGPLLNLISAALMVALGVTASSQMNGPVDPPAGADEAEIRFHRKLRIVNGQTEAAAQWAREVTDYVNSQLEGYEVQVYVQSIGAAGVIHWFVDLDSMEDFQRQYGRLESDPRFNEITSRADAFVSDSEPQDTVMRLIP